MPTTDYLNSLDEPLTPNYKFLIPMNEESEQLKYMFPNITDCIIKEMETGFKFNNEDKTITTINLLQLKDVNITVIGNNFLNNYENLTSIDLSYLSNVTLIGNNFLLNCSKLIDIDLTPLTNLNLIGNNFLDNCSNLKSIKFTQSQLKKFIPYDDENSNIENNNNNFDKLYPGKRKEMNEWYSSLGMI
jgi:hypothetical protein